MPTFPKSPTPKALKTIRSYAGHSRFLYEELDSDPADPEGLWLVVRKIPRPCNVPRPYAYSPNWEVYRWKGREVVVVETAHRCYQVFATEDLIPALPLYNEDGSQNLYV